jgi:hypothetical protein
VATATLSAMRDRVRFLGTYENSTKFTSALLNGEINAALAELYELLDDAHGGYFDKEATVATVASTATVSLPSDFWRLRGVDILISGKYYSLRQIGLDERNDFQTSTGRPAAYRTTAGGTRGTLTLYPIPSGVETIRIVYSPTYTPLVADGDSFEFYNGLEDYVICGALLRLDQREERPLGERQQELARIKDRVVKGAARRRSAEPQYLISKDSGYANEAYLYYWSD